MYSQVLRHGVPKHHIAIQVEKLFTSLRLKRKVFRPTSDRNLLIIEAAKSILVYVGHELLWDLIIMPSL